MTANHKRKARPIATVKRHPDVESVQILTAAFAHALTGKDVSERKAARWLGVGPKTVERWRDGKALVNVAKVLRVDTLAVPFTLHLCRLVAVRSRRAA